MKCMRNFFILWVSVVLLAMSQENYASDVHVAHCFIECPKVSAADTEIVVRHLFAAAIDNSTGLPAWVAYRIHPDGLGVASLLPRRWQTDRLLRTQAAYELLERDGPNSLQPILSGAPDSEASEVRENSEDMAYRTLSGEAAPDSRARLAPLTSFAGTPYWEELNYLSNMASFPADLRLGSWARLEMAINELAQDGNELHVLAGPVRGLKQSIFKVVRDGSAEAAFVFPSDLPRHADFCGQASTLEAIEADTGLNLFPALAETGRGSAASLLPALGCNVTTRNEP